MSENRRAHEGESEREKGWCGLKILPKMQNEKKRDIAEEIARRRERLKKKRFIIPKRGDEKKEKKKIPLPADYYYG